MCVCVCERQTDLKKDADIQTDERGMAKVREYERGGDVCVICISHTLGGNL